jgi:hypothetical protein
VTGGPVSSSCQNGEQITYRRPAPCVRPRETGSGGADAPSDGTFRPCTRTPRH